MANETIHENWKRYREAMAEEPDYSGPGAHFAFLMGARAATNRMLLGGVSMHDVQDEIRTLLGNCVNLRGESNGSGGTGQDD